MCEGWKKKYIRKGGVWAAEGCGWGFLERCNPGCLFYDTRAPGVECGINMVISPKAIVLKSGGHLLYMQPWAWVSRLEIPLWKWLGGWLSGGKANGSQASLKSHFQLTKRIVLGGGRLKKGLLMGKKTRECTHTHTHTHTHTYTLTHTLLSINCAWNFTSWKHLWHVKSWPNYLTALTNLLRHIKE